MSDTPHPRGIGFYRRYASSTSTPVTPVVQANVVWPPPDDEVDRVIGVGRASEPGEPSLPVGVPGGQPRPTAVPDAAENPITPGGAPEPEPDANQGVGGSPSADAAPDEPAASSAALALEAFSRSETAGGGAAMQIERHFSLSAAPKPAISLPLAFPPSGDRRGRLTGVLGLVAAAAILFFTLPGDVATLVVQSDPAGATVTVDGVARGATPFEAQLAPGEYLIELRSGERTWQKRVALRAGVQFVNYVTLAEERGSATAMLAPDAPPAADSPAPAARIAKASNTATRPATVPAVAREEPPAPRVTSGGRRGWLVVAPASRLTLLADGELLDLVAAGEERRFSLAAGSHELELVYESGARETRRLRIEAGSVARLHAHSPGRAVISTEDDAGAASTAGSVEAQSSDASTTAPPRPRDQSLPPLLMAPFPVPENARAIVELQIDERGRVARATFQRSINNFYDQRLLGALQNWRYEPALRNGQAVASTDVVEIAPGATEWSIRR